MRAFDYSDYESQLMDQDYIRMLQRPGVFQGLLKEGALQARGVDRSEEIIRKVRAKGLQVVHSDIFDYLEKVEEGYGGIFCSHLLEHLPFNRVIRLIELLIKRLEPGGVLVLVFPNSASIRLHLFGFWRDPEHVRFYTGDLIASICKYYGLTLDYSNQEETSNQIETPRFEPLSLPPSPRGWKEFFYGRRDEMEPFLLEFNKEVRVFNQKMERFSEALNKIWSRDDEVVLAFRKEKRG
jgi:SAM-dependent methyltransferase